MKSENICTVNKCPVLKGSYDILFCAKHREDWYEFCIENNIYGQHPDETIHNFIKQFQR